ncbi:MAG: hypothetical protein ACI8W8_004890 [Rhodothermales bacterium]|jgi:hypothetical protein
MGSSLRTWKNPLCISADIERASAAAVKLEGQPTQAGRVARRCWMIAYESHTTKSPSSNTGTFAAGLSASNRLRDPAT